MPRKVFTAGEVLAAADVNTFLMDQSVMTFADSGARGSAIGTATEGMLTYLADSDSFEFWNGTAYTGLGGAATNAIINGAFEINQRNFTSGTTNNVYNFDRWRTIYTGGTSTTTAELFTLGAAPVAGYESKNFYRVAVAGQSSATDFSRVQQVVESVRTFAGQTTTYSFWAKANTGTPTVGIVLLQAFGVGGSPSTAVQTDIGTVTLSTSWTRYSVTFTVPSIAGKTLGTANDDGVSVRLLLSAGASVDGNQGIGIQNFTFDTWGHQWEAGSTATEFRRNANSLQGELAACQRYFVRLASDSAAQPFGMAHGIDANAARAIVQLPVSMRANPTFSSSAASTFQKSFGSNALTSVAAAVLGTKAASVDFGRTSEFGTNNAYLITTNGTAVAFLDFSSEL
jgi:hypothetical protein